jgi:hypothetical protein
VVKAMLIFVMIDVLFSTVNPNEAAGNSAPIGILLLINCRNDGATLKQGRCSS